MADGLQQARRRFLQLGLAASALALASAHAWAADKIVAKRGRFLYSNDLIDIQLTVRLIDQSDDGAAIEPRVVGTLKGTVLRVQGRLERSGIGDAFRALRVQHADGSWHEVNIWVPLRL
jgi:hypothetical protein